MVSDIAVTQVTPDGQVGERESHLVSSSILMYHHVLVHIATTKHLSVGQNTSEMRGTTE